VLNRPLVWEYMMVCAGWATHVSVFHLVWPSNRTFDAATWTLPVASDLATLVSSSLHGLHGLWPRIDRHRVPHDHRQCHYDTVVHPGTTSSPPLTARRRTQLARGHRKSEFGGKESKNLVEEHTRSGIQSRR
jgi:hypothetical protein